MEWREWQGCDSGDAGIDRSFRERTPFWSASVPVCRRYARHAAFEQTPRAASFWQGTDHELQGLHERRSGVTCVDAIWRRGRKPAEFHLPRLLEDIRAVVQDHVQTDPTFQTTRQYCSLTAKVRHSCSAVRVRRTPRFPAPRLSGKEKLNTLGFRLRKVAKCRPPKKRGSPTNAHTRGLGVSAGRFRLSWVLWERRRNLLSEVRFR